MIQLRCKRLTNTAHLPTKAHKTDAGWDLYADENIFWKGIDPVRNVIKTGIALEIPAGYFGLVRGRSGLSWAYGTQVLAGVIDAGFRDEVKVLLKINSAVDYKNDEPFQIRKGDRIAQLCILPVPEVEIVESNFLNDSDRGNKGFGSSGN